MELERDARKSGVRHKQEETVSDSRGDAARDQDGLVPLYLVCDGSDAHPDDGAGERHHAPYDARLRHRQADLLHVQAQVGEQAGHSWNTTHML